MSKTLLWIGNNLGLGGIVRHTGNAVGTASNYALRGIGAATSHLSHDPVTKEKIKSTLTNAGQSVDGALTKSGAALGDGINRAVRVVGGVAGQAAGGAARLAGASEESVAFAQKFGSVVGALGVGVVVGVGVADVAVAFGAMAGTAGAAATTSGLATLGGGSMAAGQVVAEVITAVGGASGVVSLATTAQQGAPADGPASRGRG